MEHTREKTVADPLVAERLIAAALDADRYLDGTHFLPSDAADLAPMLARALETRSPVAVIYRDGRELLATPVLGRLGGLAPRSRSVCRRELRLPPEPRLP